MCEIQQAVRYKDRGTEQNAAGSTQGVVLNWLLNHVSHLPYTA